MLFSVFNVCGMSRIATLKVNFWRPRAKSLIFCIVSKEDQSRNTLLVTVMPHQEKITVESYATSRDYALIVF